MKILEALRHEKKDEATARDDCLVIAAEQILSSALNCGLSGSDRGIRFNGSQRCKFRVDDMHGGN